MVTLNVRYAQNSVDFYKLLFTLEKLRNYFYQTVAERLKDLRFNSSATTNIYKNSTLVRKGILSRYFSNAMPHFKEFRMMDYDIIGFDLDGTLLRYEINNMVRLEYELLKEFLVNQKNYPKELLSQKFSSDFLQKGLFIDTERGNVVKLSENGEILKAAHGTKFMNINEICQVYGDDRKWDVAEEYLKDPLSAWNGPVSEKLRALLDYFDIGAILVFAQAVDILDSKSSNKYVLAKNDYTIWPDLLDGLYRIYSREYFATEESDYFKALKENPNKYMLKTDDKVLEFLRQLKASGKALFVLTGSNIDFANFTASYALGPQWCDLFDYTVGYARKPGFFSAQRQFLKIKNLNEVDGSEIPLNQYLEPNICYSQGNWKQLKESMCKHILHKDPEKVRSLYVGDNLIQDIYAPNTISNIETLALSEELLENNNNYEFKSVVQSHLWGSYFCADGVVTLWSKIIEKYSKLCVSDIDVLAQISVTKPIHCENKEGYFPKQPEGFLSR